MKNKAYLKKPKKNLAMLIVTVVILIVLLSLTFMRIAKNDDESSLNRTNKLASLFNLDESSSEEITRKVKNKADVATGSNFTIALDINGNVFSWGLNNKGQLGNGTDKKISDSVEKTKVMVNSTTPLAGMKQIAAGEYHAAALSNDGKAVYIWGYNYFGQAGSEEKRVEPFAQKVDLPEDTVITQIACGADFTIMLTSDGKIIGLGDSTNGQLGFFNSLGFTSIRNVNEVDISNIAKISAGYNHVIALDNEGKVWSWGATTGTGFTNVSVNQITFGENKKVVDIDAGNGVSIALVQDTVEGTYSVYTWATSSTTATLISLGDNIELREEDDDDAKFDNIAVVNRTFFIIDYTNTVWSWGQNNVGQTGNTASTSAVTTLTKVTFDSSLTDDEKKIDRVTSSAIPGINRTGTVENDTIYAINTDGFVLGWGFAGTDLSVDDDGTNTYKLLGNGTRNGTSNNFADYIGSVSLRSLIREDIVLDVTTSGVSAGDNKLNIIDLLKNEEYIVGGRVNLYRSVDEDIKTTIDVQSLNDDIVSYDDETGIITGLKQGKTTLRIKAKNSTYIGVVVVGDEKAYATVKSYGDYSVALKTDGTVWAWGYSEELGIKNIEGYTQKALTVPTKVKLVDSEGSDTKFEKKIKDISVGENYVLVLTDDGKVYSWGVNNKGQLGNELAEDVTKEVALVEDSLVITIELTEVKLGTKTQVEVVDEPTTDDTTGDEAGDTTGDEAGDTTGDEAGDTTGDEAGDETGDTTGDEAGDTTGNETGDTATDPTPKYETVIERTELTNIKLIAAGKDHALAVDNENNVYAWGNNSNGQLGIGDSDDLQCEYAVKVNLAKLKADYTEKELKIKQIDAGNNTSFILTTDGYVYSWGNNTNAALGYFGDSATVPTRVKSLVKILKLSAGNNGQTYAVVVNGKVMAFGNGYNEATVLTELANVVDIYALPNKVGGIVKVAEDTTGESRVGYFTGTGSVEYFKDKDGTELTNIATINGGNEFYVITKTDGTVWTSGNNSNGQLGNRSTDSLTLPTAKEITKDYTALNKTEILLHVGEKADLSAIYNPGFNLYPLNTESVTMTYTSKDESVATVANGRITAVAQGTTYITAEGNDTTLRAKVMVVSAKETSYPVVSIGDTHAIALKTDGTVWGWGYNSKYNELNYDGERIEEAINEPTNLLLGEENKYVAAGTNYSLVVTKDGEVKAFGSNLEGQLGDGTTTEASCKKPTTVMIDKDTKLTNIVKVKVFDTTSIALDEDGNLYAWGNGIAYAKKVYVYGLKVIDITERAVLTEDGRVIEYKVDNSLDFYLKYRDLDVENVVELSSANGYYLALDGNGNVYPWTESSTSTTPVTFTDASEIVQIEQGMQVAYARDIDGKVYTWGTNTNKSVYALTENADIPSTPTMITDNGVMDPNLENAETITSSKYIGKGYVRTYISNPKGGVYGFGANGGMTYNLMGNLDSDDYYYYAKKVGESFAGFLDENGNEITRITLVKGGAQKELTATIMDSFSLKIRSLEDAVVTEFKWDTLDDIVSLEENAEYKGTVNTIISGDKAGETIVTATEQNEEEHGKIARLYVDVVDEVSSEVFPKVESAGNHTIAVKADGTVWAWGDNTNNQLGQKSGSKTILEPVQIKLAKKTEIDEPEEIKPEPVQDTTTDNTDTTDATQDSGNTTGTDTTQDSGDTTSTATAEDTVTLYKDKDGNTYIKDGDNYLDSETKKLKIVKENGKFYQWDADNNDYVYEDITDEFGKALVVVDIATSINHTVLLTKNGEVYTCGNNNYGALGQTKSTDIPAKVTGLKDIVKVAADDTYTLALDRYGKVWFMGNISYTSTITAQNVSKFSATPIKLAAMAEESRLETKTRDAIDLSNEYVLTNDGKVVSLQTKVTSIPAGTQLDPEGEVITDRIIKLTKTTGHTAFLTDTGKVYTTGKGTKGQLGNNSRIDTDRGEVVVVRNRYGEDLEDIVEIYAGDTHTLAIDKDGNMYAWGNNSDKQLRSSGSEQSGGIISRAYLTAEESRITKVIAMSAGTSHTVAVNEDGSVFAWGNGTKAQLGNKLLISSSSAVRVGSDGISLDVYNATLKEYTEEKDKNEIEIKAQSNILNLIKNPDDIVKSATSKDLTIVNAIVDTSTNTVKLTPVSAGRTVVAVKDYEDRESFVNVTVLPNGAQTVDKVIPIGKTAEPVTVSGYSHTLILKADGTVYAYGDNRYGQTTAKDSKGDLISYSDKVTKVEFPKTASTIVQVAAGDYVNFALDSNGNVYTWGQKIGATDTTSFNSTPTKITSLSKITKIVAGVSQAIAIDENGYAYSWGKNTNGSLGIGSSASTTTPTKITNVYGIIDAAIGSEHAMLLTNYGTVYTTGSNTLGQLGENGIRNRATFEKLTIDEQIVSIEAGEASNVAISINGNVYVWGQNTDGQLGINSTSNTIKRPTKVTTLPTGEKVVKASVGKNHIQLITASEKMYVAGSNAYGQLGLGENADAKVRTFTQFTALGNNSSNIMNSNAGSTYSTLILNDGTVYGFGDYNHGNFERVSMTDSFTPVLITDLGTFLEEYEAIIKIGESYTISVYGKNRLNVLYKDEESFEYSSSNEEIATVNEKGKIEAKALGTAVIYIKDEDEKIKCVTVKVIQNDKDSMFAPSIDGGDKFAIVTKETGIVSSFGTKENVALKSVPREINDSVLFRSVKAGDDFALALHNDGTVWAWGDNSSSQLGVEEIENTKQTVRLNRNYIKNVIQIDAGSKHGIALDDAGTVFVWGDNSKGQLGFDQTVEENKVIEVPTVTRPITGKTTYVAAGGDYNALVDMLGNVYILKNGVANKVNGIDNAVKVAVAENTTLILTSDGSVYTVENASNSLIPTQVSGISDKKIVDINANDGTYMLLASDKSLYVFGNNTYGQLGLGEEYKNTQNVSTPVKVAENVYTMAAGEKNTYYISIDGEVYAAGTNLDGELGNKTMETIEGSNVYVKVGDRAINIVPSKVQIAAESTGWKLYLAEEAKMPEENEQTAKVLIKEIKPYNVFNEDFVDLNEFDFTIDNEQIANIKEINLETGVITIVGTESDLPYRKTKLTITNKGTQEYKELVIYVLDVNLLRVSDLYVMDENDVILESELDDLDEEGTARYIVNIENTEAKEGAIYVDLLNDDTITAVVDRNENSYEATRLNADGTKPAKWKITGINLDQDYQEYTLRVSTKDEKTYEVKVGLYKPNVVEVDGYILGNQEVYNEDTLELEKVYTRYVDPTHETAVIKVRAGNSTGTLKLKDSNGNYIEHVAEHADTFNVNIPNNINMFTAELVNDNEEVERTYRINVEKASISGIKVTDIYQQPIEVKAEKVDPNETEYVDNYTVSLDDRNDPMKFTIEYANKNIEKVVLIDENNEETDITEAVMNQDKVDVSNSNNSVVIKVTAIDPSYKEKVTYTEEYLVNIDKISSNFKIKKVVLTYIDGKLVNEVISTASENGIESRSMSDTEHEIILHNKNVNVGTIAFDVYLDDETTLYGIGNNNINKTSGQRSTAANIFTADGATDNRSIPITIKTQAQNGDIVEHTLYVYRQSENTDIKEVSTTCTPAQDYDVVQVGQREEGTNNYTCKVYANRDSYTLEIKLLDEYSTLITNQTQIEGIENASALMTLVSAENGVYKYNIAKTAKVTVNEDGVDKEEIVSIIDRNITIVVKAEYNGDGTVPGPTESYNLVINEMDNAAEFDSLLLDGQPLDTTKDSIETAIVANAQGTLIAKATKETADVTIYSSNPDENANATKLANGTGSAQITIAKGQRETTVYAKIVSEDKTNSITKGIKVIRQSDHAELKSITASAEGFDTSEAVVDETDSKVYNIKISGRNTKPTFKFVVDDKYTTVTLDSEELKEFTETTGGKTISKEIDISNPELKTLKLTLVSEDGTVTNIYRVNVIKLSGNANIGKVELITVNSSKEIKSLADNELEYNTKVSPYAGEGDNANITLSINAEDETATIVLELVSVDGVAKSEKTTAQKSTNSIVLSAKSSSVVKVHMTAEDGSEKEYTVKVVPERDLFETVKIIGKDDSNATNTRIYSTREVLIDYKVSVDNPATINPTSTEAKITVTSELLNGSNGRIPLKITAVANPGKFDNEGSSVEKVLIDETFNTSNSDKERTFYLKLDDTNYPDGTPVKVTLTSTIDGETQSFTFAVKHGSKSTVLESVTAIGQVATDAEPYSITAEYDREQGEDTKEVVLLKSLADTYEIVPKVGSNGERYEMYKVIDKDEYNKNVYGIDITDTSKTTKVGDNKVFTFDENTDTYVFVINVISEFGTSASGGRYKFTVRVAENKTDLTDTGLDITLNDTINDRTINKVLKDYIDDTTVDNIYNIGYDDYSKTYNIDNVDIPETSNEIVLSNIKYNGESSTIQWTGITTKGPSDLTEADFADYTSETTARYDISAFSDEVYIYIKLTSEEARIADEQQRTVSDAEKLYCIIIGKVSNDTDIEDIALEAGDGIKETRNNTSANVLDTIANVKLISKSKNPNANVAIKITKVNDKELVDPIITDEEKKYTNELVIPMAQDYVVKGENDGDEETINAVDIREITVETIVTSQQSLLYPELDPESGAYTGSHEFTITKRTTNSGFTMKLNDTVSDITFDSKAAANEDWSGWTVSEENGQVVYSGTYMLTSKPTSLTINEIRTDNIYAKAKHLNNGENSASWNILYDVEEDDTYTEPFSADDRASLTQEIEISTEESTVGGSSTPKLYKITFIKRSKISTLDSITLNNFTTTKVEGKDNEFETSLLTVNNAFLPTNALNIKLNGVEGHAYTLMHVTSVTVKSTGEEKNLDVNSLPWYEKEKYVYDKNYDRQRNLYNELGSLLWYNGINYINNISGITITITITPEDTTLGSKEYKVHIDLQESLLEHALGLNLDGEISTTDETILLNSESFQAVQGVQNKLETRNVIVIPNDTETITLYDITSNVDDDTAIITDSTGKELARDDKDRRILTISDLTTSEKSYKFTINSRSISKEYAVRVRKASTDSTINKITVDGRQAELVGENTYSVIVRDDVNPTMNIVTTDANAKITKVLMGETTLTSSGNNDYTVTNFKNSSHIVDQDSMEDKDRETVLTITVISENDSKFNLTNNETTYTLKIKKLHTETGFKEVKFTDGTTDYTKTSSELPSATEPIKIASTIEGITINTIEKVCANSKIYIEVDGEKEEFNEAKFYAIDKEEVKEFKIIVESEYAIATNTTDYIKTYSFYIKRMSDRTTIDNITLSTGNGNITAVYDETAGVYKASININHNPSITVAPAYTSNTGSAKVAINSVAQKKVYAQTEGDLSGVTVTDNSTNNFSVNKLPYVDDETEDVSDINKVITVKFTIQAEDTAIIKEHTLVLTRMHVNSSIKELGYSFLEYTLAVKDGIDETVASIGEDGSIKMPEDAKIADYFDVTPNETATQTTVEFTNNNATLNLGTLTEKITLKPADLSCKYATVKYELTKLDNANEWEEIEVTNDGYDILLTENEEGDGCVRNLRVTVYAENYAQNSSAKTTYTIQIVRYARNTKLSHISVDNYSTKRYTEDMLTEAENAYVEEQGLYSIYKHEISLDAQSITISAGSLQTLAKVYIKDLDGNQLNTGTISNTASYTKDLSSLTDEDAELRFRIELQAQDETIAPKIYELIIYRVYDNTSLKSISVVPASSIEETVVSTDAKKVAFNASSYYQVKTITVNPDWTSVSLRDVLPTWDKASFKIYQIDTENPYSDDANPKEIEYTYDENAEDPGLIYTLNNIEEGKDYYFEIILTTYDGKLGIVKSKTSAPYVIHIYKETTEVNITEVKVNDEILTKAEDDEYYVYKMSDKQWYVTTIITADNKLGNNGRNSTFENKITKGTEIDSQYTSKDVLSYPYYYDTNNIAGSTIYYVDDTYTLDEAKEFVITATIKPENTFKIDNNIKPVEDYQVKIKVIRQSTKANIEEILLNKDEKHEITVGTDTKEIDVSATISSNYNYDNVMNLSSYMDEAHINSITVSDGATYTMTVQGDGTSYTEIEEDSYITVPLPNQKDKKTVTITVYPEFDKVNKDTGERLAKPVTKTLTLRRMSNKTDINLDEDNTQFTITIMDDDYLIADHSVTASKDEEENDIFTKNLRVENQSAKIVIKTDTDDANKISISNPKILDANGDEITVQKPITKQNNSGISTNNTIINVSQGRTFEYTVTVNPEDTKAEDKIKTYKLIITKQFTEELIKSILINKDRTVLYKDDSETNIDVSVTLPEDFGYYDVAEGTLQKLPSAFEKAIINQINVSDGATIEVSVDGDDNTYTEVPEETGIEVELPNLKDEKVVTIVIYSEFSGTDPDTGEREIEPTTAKIRLKRMSSITDLYSSGIEIVEPGENDKTVLDGLDEEENPIFTRNVKAKTESIDININTDASDLNNITVSVEDILDGEGVSLGETAIATAITHQENDETQSSNATSLNTKNGRTFILKIKVDPEDPNIASQIYTLVITKQDDETGIKQMLGDDVEFKVDNNSIHTGGVKGIYTHYVEADDTEVSLDIIAKSRWAVLSIDNGNGTGVGEIEDYVVDFPADSLFKEIPVHVDSEDGTQYSDYTIWFVRKSDDASIKELRVNYKNPKGKTVDVPLAPDEDGNYNLVVSDTLNDITVTLTPFYQYANASINSQDIYWKQATELITNVSKLSTNADGNVEIELMVIVPKEQSTDGSRKTNIKYLYLERVSTENTIHKITTDNSSDDEFGDIVSQIKEKRTKGVADTYDVLLYSIGDSRTGVELRIEPTSPTAKVELLDMEGNLIAEEEEGMLVVPAEKVPINKDPDTGKNTLTTYAVRVTPKLDEFYGPAVYYIDLVPPDSRAELSNIKVCEYDVELKSGVYNYAVYDSNIYSVDVSDLIDREIGDVSATAEFKTASYVNIYTNKDPLGTREQLGTAKLSNITFSEIAQISITVTSPDLKNTSTYVLWLKEGVNNYNLDNFSYTTTTNSKKTVIPITFPRPEYLDNEYAGEYRIDIEPDDKTVYMDLIAASNNATITIDNDNPNITFEARMTDDESAARIVATGLDGMTDDVTIDLIVESEIGTVGKFKILIHKHTYINGTVLTESTREQDAHKDVIVKLDDGSDHKYTINTIAGGVIPENSEVDSKTVVNDIYAGSTYNITIKKDGYLKYIINNFKPVYGVRNYIGDLELIAGDVEESDYIDLRDLVFINKLARVSSGIDNPEFGTQVINESLRKYDFNEDGWITPDDVRILSINYNKSSFTKDYSKLVRADAIVYDNIKHTIDNVTVVIGENKSTYEDALYHINNVGLGEQKVQVINSNNEVIGETTIQIVEGNAYSVEYVEPDLENEIDEYTKITLDPRMSTLSLDLIVFNGKVVVSERGKEPDIDIIPPIIDSVEINQVEDGIEFIITASDTNKLGRIEMTYEKDGVTKTAREVLVDQKDAVVTLKYENSELVFEDEVNYSITVYDIQGNTAEQSGTSTYCVLKTTDELVRLSGYLAKASSADDYNKYSTEYIKLGADMDLDGVAFTPIADNTNKPFKGTFDGNGYVIKNMNLTSTVAGTGLFGYTKGATIKNVGIESGTINSTKSYTAAIAGQAQSTTIINCYNKATIEGKTYTGGLVGRLADDSLMENCYNLGNITGSTNVGGIAGFTSAEAVLNNCYTTGKVTGTSKAGYLVGSVKDSGSGNEIVITTINNCYFVKDESSSINALGTHDMAGKNNAVADEKYEQLNASCKEVNTATLVEDLGEGFEADTYEINNGYPVLKWENAREAKKLLGRRMLTRSVAPSAAYSDEISLPLDTSYTVTSEFGTREDPITGEERTHCGIDLASSLGDAVLAIADGVVTYVGEDPNSEYGYCIEIEHIINNETFYSFYAHLNEKPTLVKGDTVIKGQQIGVEGETGKATGPHLHLEIRMTSGVYSSAVDPRNYLNF